MLIYHGNVSKPRVDHRPLAHNRGPLLLLHVIALEILVNGLVFTAPSKDVDAVIVVDNRVVVALRGEGLLRARWGDRVPRVRFH